MDTSWRWLCSKNPSPDSATATAVTAAKSEAASTIAENLGNYTKHRIANVASVDCLLVQLGYSAQRVHMQRRYQGSLKRLSYIFLM